MLRATKGYWVGRSHPSIESAIVSAGLTTRLLPFSFFCRHCNFLSLSTPFKRLKKKRKERLEEAEARRIESHAASDQGQGQLRRFQDHWQGMQQAIAGEVVSSKSPSSSPTSSVGVVSSSSNKQVGSGDAGSAADGGQKGAG